MQKQRLLQSRVYIKARAATELRVVGGVHAPVELCEEGGVELVRERRQRGAVGCCHVSHTYRHSLRSFQDIELPLIAADRCCRCRCRCPSAATIDFPESLGHCWLLQYLSCGRRRVLKYNTLLLLFGFTCRISVIVCGFK